MRSTLVLILAALTYQAASADNCPDLVSTPNASFDLGAHIFKYGDRALPKAKEILASRRAQGCDAANSPECNNAIELAAKTVDTLTACNAKKTNQVSSHPQVSESIQKDSKPKAAQHDASSSSVTGQKTRELRSEKNVLNEARGAPGCSYLTKYVPGATHKPDTYICIKGGTRKCEFMGKNEKQENIYDWLIISDSSCIHLGNWIDIDKVELEAANARKPLGELIQGD